MPPGDSPLSNYSIYKYAPANTGGLFYFDCNEPVVISQVHVDLGGSGNFALYITNLDPASVIAGAPTELSGEAIQIESQTGATFVALDEARFKTILLPYQALKLVTTNSSAAQIAQVVGSLERTYIR